MFNGIVQVHQLHVNPMEFIILIITSAIEGLCRTINLRQVREK